MPKKPIKPIRIAKNEENHSAYTIFSNIFEYINNQILSLNQSKLFAGLIIVILNIASKYVNIKLSKTVESYLKFTFSRDVLVFAITWMGTRDIYSALMLTVSFIVIFDFLLNEESMFCVLPEHFTDYHISLLDTPEISATQTTTPSTQITKAELQNLESIIEKAKILQNNLDKSK